MKDYLERVALADNHLGAQLLSALLDEIKAIPDVWQKLPKLEQDDILDRLRERVAYEVQQAAFALASNEATYLVAHLEQVTFKAGVEAKLKIHPGSPHRLDLADSTGQSVLIVLADAEEYVGGMDEFKGEADQPDLPIEEGEGGTLDPLYNDAISALASGTHCTISSLQRKLRIGYNRAARIMDAMERAGIVSCLSTGTRMFLGTAKDSD